MCANATMCSAEFSRRFPARLKRYRTTSPLETSSGGLQRSGAGVASEHIVSDPPTT